MRIRLGTYVPNHMYSPAVYQPVDISQHCTGHRYNLQYWPCYCIVVETLYVPLVSHGRKYFVLFSSPLWSRRFCLARLNGTWSSLLESLEGRADADRQMLGCISSHRTLSLYLFRGYSIILSLDLGSAVRAVTYLRVVVSPATQNKSRLFAFRANIVSRPRLTKQALDICQKISLKTRNVHCLT